MKKKRPEKKRTSWRDIQQGNPRQKTTKAARQRNLSHLLRAGILLLLLAAIATGILALRYFYQQVQPGASPPVTEASAELVFKSDGVLDADWFRVHFHDYLKPDVREIEVGPLKEELENRGQIASAAVTVSLPSRLTVRLAEREPILRVRLKRKDGSSQLVLLARDGHLYEGAGYPEDTLKRLPGLTGLKVRRGPNGFLPVEGLEPVARLLDVTKASLPAVYRHWKIIDLSDWDPEQDYRPSLVRVRSAHIEELVFSLNDIEEQIERLAGILEHTERYQMGQPRYIDLSYGDEAIIRYE